MKSLRVWWKNSNNYPTRTVNQVETDLQSRLIELFGTVEMAEDCYNEARKNPRNLSSCFEKYSAIARMEACRGRIHPQDYAKMEIGYEFSEVL